FKKHINGAEPYPWQLNITESILLGLDSIVIAGIGSGKTVPFMLPHYIPGISKNRPTIVVSPLKQLQ
ncbi:hypothetical protein C8Q75DRAFT_231386, partial [Abortiporus biennis]